MYDSVAKHFTMDVVKMTTAIRKLLITIEGEGDSKSWTAGAIAAKAIALAGIEVVAYARALGGIEIKYSWEDLLGLNRSELAKSYLLCPVCEAMVNIMLADHLLRHKAIEG